MKKYLQAREAVKFFYEKYDRYLDAAARVLLALTAFMAIFDQTGYNTTLSTPVAALIAALFCAFLPSSAITVAAAVVLIAEFFPVSLEASAVTAVLMLLMLLFYFVFRAGKSIMVVIACLCCLLKVPALIIPAAFFMAPAEILTVAFGIIFYGLIIIVKKDFTMLSSSSSLSVVGKMNLLMSDLFSGTKVILILVAVCAAMILLTGIRRQKADHAPLIGILTADVLYLIAMLVGIIFLEVNMSFLWLGVGLVLNAAVSFVIIRRVLNMDYLHTEYVEFEDDEYYYFVKAVPKPALSQEDKTVENITSFDDEVEEEEEETDEEPEEDDLADNMNISLAGLFDDIEDAGEGEEEEGAE